MIVDGHFHVWPDAIAKRAIQGPAADLERFGDGTTASAIETLAAAGIDRAVCLGVGNTPKHVEPANAFMGSLDPDHFIGFGSIHPGLSPEENVAGLRKHGLRGVKIHPLFQGYALDDPSLWETLDAMQGEFAAIIHVGEGGDAAGNARCTPAMLRDLVLRFPRLDVVACHFGGYRQLDEASELVVGLPVYLDTSWPPSVGTLDPERLREIIHRHGADRIVYASDWPMADPRAEVEAIRALGLPDDETDAILGGNLAGLLGLE
jgi:predicted TIM-barrel fold metal-dependent hydrolase